MNPDGHRMAQRTEPRHSNPGDEVVSGTDCGRGANPVVQQSGTAQPLIEEPAEVRAVRTLGRRAHRALVDMPERPPVVVVAQKRYEGAVAHQIAQVAVHDRGAIVDHVVIDGELAEIRRVAADRLGAAHHLDSQLGEIGGVRFRHGDHVLAITRPACTRRRRYHPALIVLGRKLLRPPALILGQPFVHPRRTPFVVRENSIGVDVPELVRDEPERRAAIHDHHRKLGAASIDAMHVADLRVGVRPVETLEPIEGVERSLYGEPTAPGCFVPRFVEDIHADGVVRGETPRGRVVLEVDPAFIDVGRRRGPGEMVHVFGVEAHGSFTVGGNDDRSIRDTPIGFCWHPWRARLRHSLPTRVAAHDDPGRSDDLIIAGDDRHVERAKLTIQFAGRNQCVGLPAAAVVDGNLGIPLREIIRSTAATLPPRNDGRPRVPGKTDGH